MHLDVSLSDVYATDPRVTPALDARQTIDEPEPSSGIDASSEPIGRRVS